MPPESSISLTSCFQTASGIGGRVFLLELVEEVVEDALETTDFEEDEGCGKVLPRCGGELNAATAATLFFWGVFFLGVVSIL
jgi:hypothetical protein